ncbi:hypothetical protein CAPTEDRAFT_23128, partial [Capitella teleta]
IPKVDSGSGDKYTFGELQNAVHNIAGHLQALGFSKGSNLALCATNCAEIMLMTYASWKLGGVVTLLSPVLKPGEISGQIAITKPNFMFLDKEQRQKLVEVIPDGIVTFPTMQIIFAKEGVEDELSFTSMKETITWEMQSLTPDIEARAVIFFSSGTSGPPKAVSLSHKNMLTEILGICTMLEADMLMNPKWTGLVVYLPLSHSYAFFMSTINMIIGASTIIMPRFDPMKYLQLITDYQTELMILVPPIAVLFAKNKDLVAQFNLSCIQSMFCTGAALLPEVKSTCAAQFNIKFAGYGMTEVSGASHWTPSESFMEKHGAPDSATNVGVIRDLETDEFLPAYKTGEICTSGPGVMMGYLGNKDATNATIGADGWLKSGDIGYYDKNGYFYIVGRLKELIKYKGYQVSPSELEDLLLSHPKIADAGVVGFPDLESGELPSALIVLKPGEDLSVDQIRGFVSEKAAPFKKLRGPVEIVQQIPKSASGKILRRVILSDLLEK